MIEIKQHSIVIPVNTKLGTKYMRIDEINYMNEDRFLVLIDLAKIKNTTLHFKDYFEKNPLDACIFYEHEHMKLQIENCINSFKKSEENPIPVSEVSYYSKELRFINGVTRYSWLIAADAEYIPVECRKYDFQELFDDYGYELFTPKSVKEMLGI